MGTLFSSKTDDDKLEQQNICSCPGFVNRKRAASLSLPRVPLVSTISAKEPETLRSVRPRHFKVSISADHSSAKTYPKYVTQRSYTTVQRIGRAIFSFNIQCNITIFMKVSSNRTNNITINPIVFEKLYVLTRKMGLAYRPRDY